MTLWRALVRAGPIVLVVAALGVSVIALAVPLFHEQPTPPTYPQASAGVLTSPLPFSGPSTIPWPSTTFLAPVPRVQSTIVVTPAPTAPATTTTATTAAQTTTTAPLVTLPSLPPLPTTTLTVPPVSLTVPTAPTTTAPTTTVTTSVTIPPTTTTTWPAPAVGAACPPDATPVTVLTATLICLNGLWELKL